MERTEISHPTIFITYFNPKFYNKGKFSEIYAGFQDILSQKALVQLKSSKNTSFSSKPVQDKLRKMMKLRETVLFKDRRLVLI